MKKLGKDEISQALARQRALPLFNCGDAATGMQVLEALYSGGIRFVEFTNRSAGAIDVFRTLVIKGVRGPSLMPSGGVTLDEANLKAWFAAGVHCVGIGSHLVDAKTLAEGTFADLTERARRLTSILATA